MKSLFSFIILLTAVSAATAQSVVDTAGVTIIFTRGYTGQPFYRSSLTGKVVYGGSMPKAASYINSYREYIPAEKFALVNFEEGPSGELALYSENINGRIRDYMGYDTTETIVRGGVSFGFVELGRNTRANRRIIDEFRLSTGPDIVVGFAAADYRGMEDNDSTVIVNNAAGELGVLKVSPDGKISFKKVDLSLFPGDRRYEDYFAEDAARARFFFSEPLAATPVALDSHEGLFKPNAWSELLNRFQREVSGAEISIVAPFENRQRKIEAGEITFADIYSMFPTAGKLSLVVAELSGAEVKLFLENLYTGRYYRNTTESESIKTWRDGNGTLRLQNSVRLHSLSGLGYTVNLNRGDGNKIDIDRSDKDNIYKVVFNSDMFLPSPNAIAAMCGLTEAELHERTVLMPEEDYRILLRRWIYEQEELDIHAEYGHK